VWILAAKNKVDRAQQQQHHLCKHNNNSINNIKCAKIARTQQILSFDCFMIWHTMLPSFTNASLSFEGFVA